MRSRSPRCRPMGSSMVPPPVMTPTQAATYSRAMVRASSCRLSEVCASGVRATTNKPLVSLSSRWINPARGSAASFGSSPSKAFCKVCRGFPAPGCTTRPAGLSMTSTSRSSWTRRSAMASGNTWGCAASSGGICTRTRDPASTISRGLQAARSTLTAPASIQPLIRVRECSGISRASALSSRCPANSAGTCKSITWNSGVIGHSKLAARHRVYCRAFGTHPL